jgi:hypothetical protein
LTGIVFLALPHLTHLWVSAVSWQLILGRTFMSLLLIIVVLLLLFGGGGGYYAHSRYGGAGLGGVLGLVLLILVVLWLVGALGGGPGHPI